MVWIKCVEKADTGTVLWTNASPSKSFAAQTVELSDSIFNYSFIKFIGRLRITDATPKWQTIVTSQYLAECISSINTKGVACLLTGSLNLSSGRQGRLVEASEDGLSITFGAVTSLGTSSGGSSERICPEQIIGLK